MKGDALEAVVHRVVALQTDVRPHPQTVLTVLAERQYIVVHQRRGVGRIVVVAFEGHPVITVQTVSGGYPQVAPGVLKHVGEEAARQFVGAVEADIARQRGAQREQGDKQEGEELFHSSLTRFE